jgi:hypothetical protein
MHDVCHLYWDWTSGCASRTVSANAAASGVFVRLRAHSSILQVARIISVAKRTESGRSLYRNSYRCLNWEESTARSSPVNNPRVCAESKELATLASSSKEQSRSEPLFGLRETVRHGVVDDGLHLSCGLF